MDSKSTLTLPSDTEIRMTRVFNAPPELLFKTMSNPAFIPQWWGYGTQVEKHDFRVGGKWRFVQHDDDGNANGFGGEFREIMPPLRFVQTFEWDGMPGHILTESMEFEDLGNGQTRLINTSQFANKEDRDGMLASGMEGGANDSWDRLEALVAQQTAAH